MPRGFVPLLAAVLACGIGALAWATEGFRVVTSEGARRLAVERAPRAVPDIRLIDQEGQAFSLADYRGRVLLLEFIYTRCPTICGVFGEDFRRVQDIERRSASHPDTDLVSISFDPASDDREALKLYADRYGAKAPHWRVAAPADARDLAGLLKTFDVTVIADGLGGFVHDGAVYLVNAQGRLVRILDADPPPQLVAGSRSAVP
jgi:protein SCO1/2